MLGHDTETPDDQPTVSATKTRSNRFYGITLKQLVDGGLLKAGDKLTSMNGVWPATATVGADGGVVFNGITYASPSKAASAAKNGMAANGWDFWAVDRAAGATTLATMRSRWLEQHQLEAGDPARNST